MQEVTEFSSAADVIGSMVPAQGARAGSSPSAALHLIEVRPISVRVARLIFEREHYLHSLPGGTMLCFGAFFQGQLLGALAFGAGPSLAYSLVEGASPQDCATLTRLWLSDKLPPNSESRVIGITLRALRKHTALKFLVSYADPSAGHIGTIYQATGWLYTGLSSIMPLYDIGDGVPRHSRSLAHSFGSHSVEHFRRNGVEIKLIPQAAKHRYIKFLDPTWRSRLTVPVLPYPRKEASK